MSQSQAPAVALCLPIAVISLVLAAVTLGERAGGGPFSALVPENVAEAAAVGSAVHVERFLAMGEDPTRIYELRPFAISSAVRRATALEAVIWSRQVELVQLLDVRGAIVDHSTRRALACLASDLKVEDVTEYLAGNTAPMCEPGEAFARVLARTSSSAAIER